MGTDGSIDWLCLPRFDSASTFGALLGTDDHGRWLVAPAASVADDGAGVSSSRRYVDDTFTLVTRWVTPTGEVDVIDVMPHGDRRADVIRRVVGVSGSVDMLQELRIRFDYGAAMPWIRQMPDAGGHAIVAVAGPDALVVRGPELTASDHAHVGEFTVTAGETVDITLTWFPAHRAAPAPLNVGSRIRETEKWWKSWASATTTAAKYSDAVRRSLLVLRALSHEDTGGIVAAATTSLPEEFGGSRNWDYRYVWLRDASLTLHVLLDHGFEGEADPWRRWLLRAIAGDPGDVQIMYGLSGERRLTETVIEGMPGYNGAAPVRVGNAAFTQYQGDVFGEVMLALERARETGGEERDFSWPLQRALMGFVEENWQRPDNGIWEIRGPQRHFTHSRVMLWAAFDCAIRAVRDFGLDGPVERWEEMRALVADEIETQGFDPVRGTYTQYYGGTSVDASLLQLVQTGYIAADDPRMLGTVAAIEADLLEDGLLLRYRTESGVDGLPEGENPFLACSFWLVEQYASSGRLADATALMDRLVGFCNDVGLLSEEYDVAGARQAGNTPQAFSHLSLVRAADAISKASAAGE
ncbi:GH15 family glucan-1,4-alpha-glucosidase [Conyzicola lurida]|uniref:GH15 family glucan-1,4-alpha-glucosidase n=1 Tax=Conyzicola lurida TaxID=1172621 RepID=A0A841AJR1_9MICO|nr:GH15 family glucan-1,4-alpha-glucosidase [Conyzicola lurida]